MTHPTALNSDRLLLVDHDAAALNGVCGIRVVEVIQLVVIDNVLHQLVPDLDAEPVNSSTAIDLPIVGGQQKAIVSLAVDGT